MHKRLSQALIVTGSVAAIAVAAVVFTAYKQLNPALPPPMAELGKTGVADAKGTPIRLAQAVAPGSAAIVAFWATWCVPCRSEATALAKLRRKYNASDLSIAYLNVDQQPNEAATAKFLRATHAESLPVLYAGHAGWATITGQQTEILPRAYVFDRSGRAVAAIGGSKNDGSTGELEASVATAVR